MGRIKGRVGEEYIEEAIEDMCFREEGVSGKKEEMGGGVGVLIELGR